MASYNLTTWHNKYFEEQARLQRYVHVLDENYPLITATTTTSSNGTEETIWIGCKPSENDLREKETRANFLEAIDRGWV